jgi:hypothetical protein
MVDAKRTDEPMDELQQRFNNWSQPRGSLSRYHDSLSLQAPSPVGSVERYKGKQEPWLVF